MVDFVFLYGDVLDYLYVSTQVHLDPHAQSAPHTGVEFFEYGSPHG